MSLINPIANGFVSKIPQKLSSFPAPIGNLPNKLQKPLGIPNQARNNAKHRLLRPFSTSTAQERVGYRGSGWIRQYSASRTL